MRKLYLTLISIALCGLTFAQSVSQQEAAVVAQRFLEKQGKSLVRCAKTVESPVGNLLYIFNAENAFVVVAGDKNVQPVLAYIDHQLYTDAVSVAPFEMWMTHYANQIEKIRKERINQPQYADYWQRILSGAPVFRNGDGIDSLLLSKWDQGEFYNYYCPRDIAGPNGRVVTGCVATAMAQLIYYFRFPETGTGSYSYTDEHYGVQSADYGNATYNYNAMCDVPTAINTEISKLIYHCGVGVDMHYGPDGSGMTNHSAARVLRTFFKFSPETEYLYRDSTDLNWDSVIVSHLNRRIPMYYAGWSVPDINGHGFICDGYKTVDNRYYFHFNFGWSGYRDGFFYTDALIVGSYNFNLAQELIINGYPDTTQYLYPTPQPLTGSLTLTAGEGTFTDGSQASETCASGMDFLWSIEPEVSNLTGITLDLHYDLATGDTLFVFSNAAYFNTQTLTGDTGIFHLDMNIPELQVRLVTHSNASAGFRAHYHTQNEVFCAGTRILTTPTGHFEDGSGNAEYNNFSDCRFRVIANTYTAIRVHINSLDLEEGKDFLHFYQDQIAANNLVLSLTGHLSDTNITINSRRLTMVLETDETGTDAGFDLDYEAGYVGIDPHSNQNMSIYPNPASDQITINSVEPIESVEIFNVEGKQVCIAHPHTEEFTLPIQQLPAGVYMTTIRTASQIINKKVVKL